MIVAGMVTMILQPSVVWRQGDEDGLLAKLDRGLTQGGQTSPELLNLIMDTLIAVIKKSLEVLQRDDASSDGSPLLSFADNVVLQLKSDIEAAIALRAAKQWAKWAGMVFNMGAGKSGVLICMGRRCAPSC